MEMSSDLLLEAKVFLFCYVRSTASFHQALSHILWKTKRWRDVLLVGRVANKAKGTTRADEENGLGDANVDTEPSEEDVQAETSGQRKEEDGHSLRFVNKVSPSPESDTDSIEEAENRF